MLIPRVYDSASKSVGTSRDEKVTKIPFIYPNLAWSLSRETTAVKDLLGIEYLHNRALHCRTMQPTPHWKTSEGLKRAVLTGGTITTPPWQGYSGRCFVVRFHHSTGGGYRSVEGEARFHVPGTCTFELQARIQGGSTLDTPTDGLGSDEEGPAPAKSQKTRRADKRMSYTNRKRAAVVAELRELESDHADRIWRVYGMSCQKLLARKTGIAQPNICKWQQDEAKYMRPPVMT